MFSALDHGVLRKVALNPKSTMYVGPLQSHFMSLGPRSLSCRTLTICDCCPQVFTPMCPCFPTGMTELERPIWCCGKDGVWLLSVPSVMDSVLLFFLNCWVRRKSCKSILGSSMILPEKGSHDYGVLLKPGLYEWAISETMVDVETSPAAEGFRYWQPWSVFWL